MHKFSENLFQNAIDLNETIVFEYDAVGDVITFSENIKKYIPVSPRITAFLNNTNLIGKVYDEDIEKIIAFFSSPLDGGKMKMEYIRFLNFSGEYCWYQLKARFDNNEKGAVKSVYGIMSYIDDETKKMDDEKSAAKDALTHLLTMQSFAESAKTYLSEIPNDVIPNLMIIDLDDFMDRRSIYGEIESDGVLVEIGRILKRAFRNSDIIGYLKEDRFGVMMKGVKSTGILLERADYIRQTVKEVWSDFDNKGALTVSIGVAAMHRQDATTDELFKRAEAALTDAKKSGKDNYVLYSFDDERLDTTVNPILTSKEITTIKGILDPMSTWAYAVDENYSLVYGNEILEDRIGSCSEGLCYNRIKGYDDPCSDCPIPLMEEKDLTYDCEVYSPSLRAEIPARASRIVMRNGKSVFVMASAREDIEAQLKALEESEDRIRGSLYELPDIIWDINISRNRCVRVKEEKIACIIDNRVKNYEKLRAYYLENIVFADDKEAFLNCSDPKYVKQYALSGQHSISREVRLKTADGEYRWYGIATKIVEDGQNIEEDELLLSNSSNNGESDIRIMLICTDIDEYKRRSLMQVESRIRYELIHEKRNILKDMSLDYERYENVNDMIGILVFEYTVATSQYYLCSNFEDIFEIEGSALDNEWSLLESLKCYEEDREVYEEFLKRARTSSSIEKVTVRFYNRHQVPVWYTIVLQVLRGLNNAPERYLGTLQNVNTEMRIKTEMEYRADYDSITGLYNSETFYRKTNELIHLNPDVNYVIMTADIDRFRLINDRYGIESGNKLLRALGKLIREALPKNGIAKRYQSDVFSILLPYESDQNLVEFMTGLSNALRDARNLPMQATLTYGIYKIVDREIPVRLMCDRARAVKKQVKNNAMANYAVYDDVIRLKLREQAEIEEEMQLALAKREFVMFLQPQIDIKSGRMIGAEALVRWQHPTKGIMVPAQFLGLFESNGFITKMDKYIWEEACRYLKELQNKGIFVPISVNISRVHIGKTNLSDILNEMVNRYEIDPKYLELEITENLFMDDVQELFDEMTKLKEAGFKILMDDFGSGYSSLNMLRNAPVDILKIDRFFLDEIMSTDRGKIIVESSVRMAKQLGLVVVAEGVETQEQLDFLAGIDCDIAQGYYYSKPVDKTMFEKFMYKYL